MSSLQDAVSTLVNTNTLLAKLQQTLASGLPSLLPNGIPLTSLAQIPGLNFLGNATGSTGNVTAVAATTAAGILPLRSYLAGMMLSNDVTNPNTVIDISAGQATDSTNAFAMTLTPWSKSTGGTWAMGSGANGMGVGLTISSGTWYHVHAILNSGSVDAYLDTSLTAANAPTGTTAYRRIGSIKTAATATAITAFIQDGDYFWWKTPALDVNATNSTGVATAALSVPPINVLSQLMLNLTLTVAQAGVGNTVWDPDVNKPNDFSVAAATEVAAGGGGVGLSATHAQIRTNVSGQVNWVSSYTSGSFSIQTLGWLDTRGRSA